MYRILRHISLFVLLLSVAPLQAQETGGDLPTLDLGNITITGQRMVRLPPARKGEVFDTSLYQLPAGDTLMFGERISNFGGPGGVLPGYRELASPVHFDAEASIGSYLSPWAQVHGEYIQRSYDVAGTISYQGTGGHVDNSSASSLLIAAHGGLLVGGSDPGQPKSRIEGRFDRIGDSYTLYGTRAAPFDRGRVTTRFVVGLRSQHDALVDYDINLGFTHSGIEDRLGDSSGSASANTPGASLRFSVGSDTIRGLLRFDYSITSLGYARSSRSPNFVSLLVGAEWQPAPRFYLTGGVLYAGGQNSDSGSQTMLMPRLSLRYLLTPELSLFGRFDPEMRAPSYRDRIMQSPYVEREMVLRPERIPLRLVGGLRLASERATIEARALIESAGNTPVVATDSTGSGSLRYLHLASRTIGIEADARLELLSWLSLSGEFAFRSSVDPDRDRQLPMRPALDVRGRADYSLSSAINLFATVQFQSSQNVGLSRAEAPSPGSIPAIFLLGGGGAFRLTPDIELFGEVTNLLATSYKLYDNYQGPGLELRAGARMVF